MYYINNVKPKTMKIKKILSLSAVVGLMFSFASCKDPQAADDEAMGSILNQYVENTIAPTYSNLAAKSQELVDALRTLQSNKTDANVQAVCNIFLEARSWWEKSEAFLFGPANDFGIDPHIDSWPLDETGFNTMMNNTAQMQALAGDDGDVYAGDYLGNALLGFHGIEYVLFENGAPKSASAISDLYLTYAVAVAGDLRNRCFQLEVSWLGNKAPAAHVARMEELEFNTTVNGGSFSYGENMLKAGNAGSTYATRASALAVIIDGCCSIADEVGTSKIGKPYNGEDPTYIESPYSQKSIEDFYDNIISIQNSYMGGVEGRRDESKSLHHFVAEKDKDLDAEVMAAISEALRAIHNMKHPFVNNITDPSAGVASDVCQKLDETMAKVARVLK